MYKYIIILLIIILCLLYANNKYEHALLPTQSNQAVQNLASVFSDVSGTVIINNLKSSSVNSNINLSQFKGIIVMWSGNITDKPVGWELCDGSTYTALDGTQLKSPDLRSMFVLGASKPGTPSNQTVGGPNGQPSIPYIAWLTPKTVGEFGGEETHILQLDEMPPHSHATNVVVDAGGAVYSSWGNPIQAHSKSIYAIWNGTPGGSGYLPHTSYVGGNTTIGYTDANINTMITTPHQNMPPYYALAYIIKL